MLGQRLVGLLLENLCPEAFPTLLLSCCLVPGGADLTLRRWTDFATRPARYRIASNHLPASRGHLAKAPGASDDKSRGSKHMRLSLCGAGGDPVCRPKAALPRRKTLSRSTTESPHDS